MKKKFFGFLTAILTLGVLGGTAFVVASDNIQKEEPAYAATIGASTKLYLKPNSNWRSDGARFAAYFFGNGEAWVSMVDSNADGIYEVTSPTKSYNNVIFCRMNGSTNTNNWDGSNKWNQTSDLTYDGTNNLYTVKEGTWNNGGGTWSTISKNNIPGNFYKKGDEIFVNVSNADWSAAGAKTGAWIWENGKDGKFYFSQSVDGSNSIVKISVPVDNALVQILRINPTNALTDGQSDYPDSDADWGKIDTTFTNYNNYNYVEINGYTSCKEINFTVNYANLENWASELVGQGKCDPDGDKSTYNWETLKSNYNNLTIGEKTILKTAKADEKGSAVQHALATYDFLVTEKKLEGFIEDRTQGTKSIVLLQNQTIIPVVVISFILISVLSAFVIYRKRRIY